MLFIEFWKASWEAEKLGTVSSLSLQARGSSGCLVKTPPHYLHCTRGGHSMSSLRRFSSLNHTAAFLNRSHLCFYIIEMKITEPPPHQIHSMFYSASLSSGKGNDPSLKGNVLHFACSPCCFFRMWNQKHKIASIWGVLFILFFFPSNGLRYFKCCLSFRGRAASDMALRCVNNCHPESLTVWSAWLE